MFNFFQGGLLMILARILAFATAIPFHEAAHAFVSDKLGDHTARDLGRLSLNPLRHLDPWGLLAMMVIGIGWAKPVPINTAGYKNPRVGMAITALAGPVSNLVLGYICMVFYKVVAYTGQLQGATAGAFDGVTTVLLYLVIININLAVFNMLPIPPFDGSRVFGLILPEKWYFKVMKYERFIMFAVLVLVWGGLLSKPLSALNQWVLSGIAWATGYIDLFFMAMFG